MTETRAFGRPFGGFEARVVDAEDREVPAGVEGELVGAPQRGGAAARLLLGLSQERGGDGGGLARRLVPHRRRGAPGRRRHAHLRGPQEAHHPPLGREHRRRGGGGGAPGARRRGPGGRAGRGRRSARGGGAGLRGADAGRCGRPGVGRGPVRALQRAPRLLQGTRLGAVPRPPADHRHAEGAEDPDLRRRRGPAQGAGIVDLRGRKRRG